MGMVYVALLGAFAFVVQRGYNNFRGTSETAKTMLAIVGGLGYLAFFIFLIWGFFRFAWWQPILAFVGAVVAGVVLDMILNNSFGEIIALLAVPILTGVCVYLFI